MARRPHRCDHRRGQQGRHDVAVRVAVDAPRRRAVVDQGDALLPPARATGSRSPPAAEWDALLRRRRRPARAPRGDAVVLLRRRARRRGDARPAREPHVLVVLREPVSRAISFFTYQKIRLRFPADYPIADYLAAADRLDRRRLPRSREREVHGVPRWLLRRLPPGLARHASAPSACTSSTSSGSSATRSATLHDTAAVARPRSRALPRRRAQLREPHHRVQEQGLPAGRARRQRPARAGAAPSSRRQAQAARLLLPAQRPSGRGARSPTRCAPSSRRATRSRTRGSPSSSTPPGSPLPGWLSPTATDRSGVARRRVVAALATAGSSIGA